LEAAREYVRNLIASGGEITLSVHLPGRVNLGDSFDANKLLRIGRLGVELSVEVFPEMN